MTVYLWIVIGTIAVFLVVFYFLLRRVPPRYTIDTGKEEIDHRVVHFTLRLALAFGIGAVIIGVLLVAALLGLQFIGSG